MLICDIDTSDDNLWDPVRIGCRTGTGEEYDLALKSFLLN